MTRFPRPARRVGPLITAVGVVHVASTPVFFPESVRSIRDGGILDTLSAEPSATPVRAAGFWFAMAGVALAAFGWVTGHVERTGAAVPAAVPAVLAGMGAVGVALDRRSGFWLFFPLAWIAHRRAGGAEAPAPAPGLTGVAPVRTSPAGPEAGRRRSAR